MLRFAPSPTGDMLIGELRIAILNYVVAQQKKESFLVRISDRDTKKSIEGKDTEIMMILEKFAIKHDSVYHQSEHLRIHQNLALRLLKEDKAFICRCKEEGLDSCLGECDTLSKEEYASLKESGEEFVIRFKQTSDEVGSFAILEKSGIPTHDFACACDDMLSDVELIIYSEEHPIDTLKHQYIKRALGYERDTEYVHLPVVLNDNKEFSIKWLFEEGFIPDAILNYLLLLGNSNAPKEIFTLPEAIEWFNLDRISKSAVEFDMDRLRHINREHLKMIDDRELSTLFGFADADIGRLAKVYLEEASTIKELEAKIAPIFKPKNFDGEWGEQMRIIEKIIMDAPAFETFNELTEHIMEKSELKDENLFNPLRVLLTGGEKSPQLSKIYPFIKSYILEVAS